MTPRLGLSMLVVLFVVGLPCTGQSVRPAEDDGKPLNLDFETGTLSGWTVEGEAFAGQPVKGDTVTARGRGMISGHQGDYWIGGYEKSLSDQATGTLTSAAFKVTHRWATFMVGGGSSGKTRVELVADDGKPFFQASGTDNERLWPVLVDLEKQQGKSIRIRLVDQHTGGWGHVNFDDFRFHAEKPDIRPRPEAPGIATAAANKALSADSFKHAGLSAEEAAKAMTLPPGFKAQVFAAEPDVINPIAFTIDARGRLWVAQSFTYPVRAPEGEGKDSIIILEDTDGDGKHDKRTVFAEKLNLVSGIEVGFGGVYVGAAPYLLHIPTDLSADEPKPTGEPKVLLDGWGYQDTHETLNSFMWGPDGWLYGCHGVFTKSLVGKPGTPKEQRQYIDAGVWRYHPTKHIFERFAEGTSNPWGLDFDEHGQMFIEACVIPHLWHVIQGARYQRQAGQHNNPYTFDDIKQIGDHVHYLGATPHSGNNKSDSAGGGHAHSGLMVYLGDNWPDEYRGKIFMNNIHGARINMDIPEPKGSGYVGRHGKDFLLANDRASQIIAMRYGPDGAVYFADWYDLQQCHTRNPKDHDRTTGRIFKVSYGDVKPAKVDLEKLSDFELVKLQEHKNQWNSRTARRVLQERATTKEIDESALDWLWTQANRGQHLAQKQSRVLEWNQAKETSSLNAYLAMLATDTLIRKYRGMTATFVRRASTGLHFACEEALLAKYGPQHMDTELGFFAEGRFPPVARLAVTSAILRLPADKRWGTLELLLSHSEDATDHNLPLMYWYALEPLLDVDASRALDLAANTKIPNILNFSARKLAMIGGEKNLDLLASLLLNDKYAAGRGDILRGMTIGLKGRRDVAAPKEWDKVAAALGGASDAQVTELVRSLSVTFGSKTAMADMRKVLADTNAKADDRNAALAALLTAKDPDLAPSLLSLLDDAAVRAAAIRGLANYDDGKIPAALIGRYNQLPTAEKKDALATLASRPAFAVALLNAVDQQVPKADFSADLLRQLRAMKGNEVADLLNKYWAAVNETDADKLAKMSKYKKLVDGQGPAVNLARGRELFNTTCASCHTLFGEGGKVGPDITGSDRANLDYLLHNVVDPNAVIPADYQAWQLDTKDDRTLIGILKQQDGQTVTIQTTTEIVTINRADVAKLKPSPLSMMPEGALDALSETDVRNLIAYLRSPKQVPLGAPSAPGGNTEPKPSQPKAAPAEIPLQGGGELPAGQLFNGKDLTGWQWQMDGLWSVEDGAIVGKTVTGLKKNQFLTSTQSFKDFRLIVKMKLSPNKENSGIQFRSVRIPGSHEMRGCQADAGAGWWGKLYEESSRGLLFPKKGEKFDATPLLKIDDWNTYEILAVGGKVRTAVNGKPCTVLDDDAIAKEGVFGLQVHSGGPMEVRWKEFELEVDPKFELKTVQ